MSFVTKIADKKPALSYEFYPPKNPDGWSTLYSTLGDMRSQHPDFVSVTYGAGGSTREQTISLVGRIQNELELEAMAHLTCVGHSKDELARILEKLIKDNIPAIMALRGDPPKGESEFKPHPDGFRYASELIAFIRERYDMAIGCACYPEMHLEAESLEKDIEHLKIKQDMGADFAVTQLFFDNEKFYRFRDMAGKAGITLPLVAGIMPVNSVGQLTRFKELSGCTIPKKLVELLDKASESDVTQRGIAYGIDQCSDLLENGIAGIHFYTMNRSGSSLAISDALRSRGYFD